MTDEQLTATSLRDGARGRPPPSSSWLMRLARGFLLSDYFVLYLTLIFFVVAALIFPTLPLPLNIANQLQNMYPLLAVAIGQTFVLILGGIDLSVGAIMGITSVAGAVVMAQTLDASTFDKSPLWGNLLTPAGGVLAGQPSAVLVGVIVMLTLGTLIGFLNGFAITRFNLAPFMVTLVTATFFAAFALWLTQSRNISGLPPAFLDLGKGDIVSIYLGVKATPEIARRDILPFITYPFVIAVGLAVVAQFILSRTVFGRRMFFIGTNRQASVISGVPTRRTIIAVYMFSGFCAAVASILYSARIGFGQPSLGGGNLLLDVIGAAVIGGTSLFGGKGSVRGTFFGVAFFVLLLNILNAMRLSPFIIDAVKGMFILVAALLDITRTRLLDRERRA
ncbi:MAG: ABC transporter permease [Chloroflexota bacterium]|nr:ABC transporter permease [Chloroflexota bacterium]